MRPGICASPDDLARHGTPAHPRDLRDHVSLTCGFLLTGNQWKLTGADGDHCLAGDAVLIVPVSTQIPC